MSIINDEVIAKFTQDLYGPDIGGATIGNTSRHENGGNYDRLASLKKKKYDAADRSI